MDFMEYQNPEALTKSKKPESMGRFLQFLLLVSIFSFLLSYHSSCPPCFLHYFIKLCSTKSLANGLNHCMHSKPMLMLLFNVFLLYLTRNSSSLDPSEEFLQDTSLHHDEFVDASMGIHQSLQSESFEEEARFEDKEVKVETDRPLELVLVVDGGVKNKLVGVHDELELLGVDELNKRFEEFIEREKRRRRLEALQLIPV